MRELGALEIGVLALAAGREEVREQRLQQAETLRRHRSREPLGERYRRVDPALAPDHGRLAAVRLAELVQPLRHRLTELLGLERNGATVLPEDPAARARVRESVSKTSSSSVPGVRERPLTHQAVSSRTAIRAWPTISPICQGRGTRWASTSKSVREAEVTLAAVAKRMSLRILDTRNVRIDVRSRSCPITYQTPFVEAKGVRVERALADAVLNGDE